MTPEVKERIEQIRHGIVPEGYQKTAAGIIPNDWKCSAIHDCLNIKNNERKPISEEVRKTIPGPYPYYGPTQAQGYINTYISEGPAVLIGEDGDHFLKYSVKPMTLFVDGKYTVNNHAHIVLGTDRCATKWFFYAYHHKSLFTALTRQGAGRYKLTKEALEKLIVQYPCVQEQNQIIDIISSQDKVIDLKEKLLAEKQRQKKYLMQQLLTGKKRLPGFDGEWKTVRLGHISKRIRERNHIGSTNVMTISAQFGLINQEEFFNKTIASDDKSNYFLLHRNDFAYNKSYSTGYPYGAIKRLTRYDSGIVSPLYICFRIKRMDVSVDFMAHYFEAGLMNREIQAFAQEGARNHGLLNIAVEDFFNSKITLPPFEEQQAIAAILTTADKEIDLLRQDLEQEKQKKKALMQLLLTGIVRVNA